MPIEIHVTSVSFNGEVRGHECSTHCPFGESCKIIGDKHYPQLQGSTSPDDGACKPGEIVPLGESDYYIVSRPEGDYDAGWTMVFRFNERGRAEAEVMYLLRMNDDMTNNEYKIILI